ncbi:ferrochelatase [Salpingoeca rosetta]|uniref:Ferrochelatase n=1 Tax=Salpingoeca rosetta (strain ATCC 50818 / BSB-021) TaxID=946362 RepID=F2UCJ9_SALR5|nr:ferrochelatase [Salpingoeca rosetta]EGD74306.1 ferrochelatase [Salpingoeca rosetta]|eukprot:XP_004993206.1 ferrochelatase [Salpingoeca rosetta]
MQEFQHRTEECERAVSFDTARVDGATQLGAAVFWAAVTSGAGYRLLAHDEQGQGLLALLGLQDAAQLGSAVHEAVGFLVWGTSALQRNQVPALSLRFVRVAVKAAAWLALTAMSYCPVGRLVFGRPLRRLAITCAQQGSAAHAGAMARFARAFAAMATSKQGLLALLNAAILPMLQRALRGAGTDTGLLRGVLGTVVTSLRVILTVTSAVATYTQLRPAHLVPSNPWEAEPAHMEYLRKTALATVHEHGDDGIDENTPAGGPIGVLVCNLGTTPTPRATDVAQFLKEFLMDPRVVEVAPWVWSMVLNGFIIPIRKYTSGQLYERLFQNAGTGNTSPLVHHTSRFTQQVQQHLGSNYVVEYGMRYGEPSIGSALAALKRRECERVIVLPKYPQYSGTTTASIYDEVFACARRYRFVPAIRIVPPFYSHPAYIQAIVATASQFLAQHSNIERFVISFHGIPERYHLRGDPYPWHCEATARAIAAGMCWSKDQWMLSYQSVFGKDPWLLPATDATVEELGKQGVKRIAVLCPGFLTDCLETIDENGTENANVFKENGGEELVLVPCLNSSPEWCEAAAAIIQHEARGWE